MMNRILYSFEDIQPKKNAGTMDDPKQSLHEKNTSQTDKKASGKTAYLTFDDGPSEFTPRLLDVLKKNDIPATFFISFLNEDTPEKRKALKRETAEGHMVGVHSFSHDYFDVYANEENFLKDFKKMRDIIRDTTGVDPKISRFPGGTSNIVSIAASCGQMIMPRLAKDVESMGFRIFDWNAGGQDAQCPHPATKQLVHDILTEVKGQDNLIILLHDTFSFSVDAVPALAGALRGQGYVFKVLKPDSPKVQHSFAKKEEIISSLKVSLKMFGYFLERMESS